MPNLPVSPSPAQVPLSPPRVAMQAALAASLLALCPLAQAQSDASEPPYGMSGRLGLGVATVPTYEGSDERRTLAVPDLSLSYRSHDWGTVAFDQRGLTWTAVEADAFRLALVAQFDPGRKDKDPSALDPTPGDKRLSGMGKVKSSTEAGVGIGYGPLMLVARQSLSNHGPKGVQAELSAGIPWALSDSFTLHFSAGATWANKDYMQTYFGVTPAQAKATSFAVYTPKSGVRKVELNIGAECVLAPSWTLQANVGVSRLGDEAAASPLVSRRNGVTAMLGVARVF